PSRLLAPHVAGRADSARLPPTLSGADESAQLDEQPTIRGAVRILRARRGRRTRPLAPGRRPPQADGKRVGAERRPPGKKLDAVHERQEHEKISEVTAGQSLELGHPLLVAAVSARTEA